MKDVIRHYDMLIDEKNDPVFDPPELRDYMDKWDGQAFIDALGNMCDKSVLEIGIGTGRLAVKVAKLCNNFSGIDISPKTIEVAKANLSGYSNIKLYCGDFLFYTFPDKYDVIYSSLTFMHISQKRAAVNKIASLLATGGIFVLSVDKNQSEYLTYGSRKIKLYPDDKHTLCEYIISSGMRIEKQFEAPFAHIIKAIK